LDPVLSTQQWAKKRWLLGSELHPGDQTGEYRFAFGNVVVGRYVIGVTPGGVLQPVTVAADTNEPLRIEVPKPVDDVVRIIDGETKSARTGASLTWNVKRPREMNGGSVETASAAKDAHEIRFRVPAGKIEVEAFERDYEVPAATLDVSAEK